MKSRYRVAFHAALLAAIGATTWTSTTAAALIHPLDDTSKFPDLSAGFADGSVRYSAATGQFRVENTPFVLAYGTSGADQFDVNATADGIRRQSLVVQLDSTGKLDPSGSNLYELTGSVTIDGQIFSGLLLQATPVAFGSLDTSALARGTSMYDFDLKITGGLLADVFIKSEAYLRLVANTRSTFDGDFSRDFSAASVASNLRGFSANPPKPVPEPAAVATLLGGCVIGLWARRRARNRLA